MLCCAHICYIFTNRSMPCLHAECQAECLVRGKDLERVNQVVPTSSSVDFACYLVLCHLRIALCIQRQ